MSDTVKVKWLGEPDGNETTTMNGVTYKRGEFVDVSTEEAVRLLSNPFFETENTRSAKQAAADAKAKADADAAKNGGGA